MSGATLIGADLAAVRSRGEATALATNITLGVVCLFAVLSPFVDWAAVD